MGFDKPKTPQAEIKEAQKTPENQKQVSLKQNLDRQEANLVATFDKNMSRLSGFENIKGKEKLTLQQIGDLFRFASVKARFETRDIDKYITKADIRAKLGKISVKLRQEIKSKTDPKSLLKGQTAELYKTKFEIKALAAFLGLDNYQKGTKKPYFGIEVDAGKLKIYPILEFKNKGEETSKNARVKASLQAAKDLNLFADITLSNFTGPSIGIDNLRTTLGANLKNGTSIVASFNPRNIGSDDPTRFFASVKVMGKF